MKLFVAFLFVLQFICIQSADTVINMSFQDMMKQPKPCPVPPQSQAPTFAPSAGPSMASSAAPTTSSPTTAIPTTEAPTAAPTAPTSPPSTHSSCIRVSQVDFTLQTIEITNFCTVAVDVSTYFLFTAFPQTAFSVIPAGSPALAPGGKIIQPLGTTWNLSADGGEIAMFPGTPTITQMIDYARWGQATFTSNLESMGIQESVWVFGDRISSAATTKLCFTGDAVQNVGAPGWDPC